MPCRLVVTEFMGLQLRGTSASSVITRHKCNRSMALTIKSLAMELTKEARPSGEHWRISRVFDFMVATSPNSRSLWPLPNKADDSKLHNPLQHQERMGYGWFRVIFEWEGVIVEGDPELKRRAWLVLSQEEGKSRPPAFILRRIEGMKNEQVISEVLCWSRAPAELRRLASRKEAIHQILQGGGLYQMRSGSQEFMSTLFNHAIPIAVASTRPRQNLQEAIEAAGAQSYFDVIVAAKDVHWGKPDPEMFVYAAQLLNFIPERCIVFGNSN